MRILNEIKRVLEKRDKGRKKEEKNLQREKNLWRGRFLYRSDPRTDSPNCGSSLDYASHQSHHLH